jgi:hypothetical protein
MSLPRAAGASRSDSNVGKVRGICSSASSPVVKRSARSLAEGRAASASNPPVTPHVQRGGSPEAPARGRRAEEGQASGFQQELRQALPAVEGVHFPQALPTDGQRPHPGVRGAAGSAAPPSRPQVQDAQTVRSRGGQRGARKTSHVQLERPQRTEAGERAEILHGRTADERQVREPLPTRRPPRCRARPIRTFPAKNSVVRLHAEGPESDGLRSRRR